MAGLLLRFVVSRFKDKRFIICFVAIGVLLLIVTAPLIGILPILIPLPIIAAFLLALAVRAIWAGIGSAAIVATGSARVKELAEEMPQLAEFEKRRTALVGMRLIFFLAAIALAVLGAVVAHIFGITAAIIVAFIVYFAVINPKANTLRSDFKEVVVLDELCRVFEDVKYNSSERISSAEVDSLGLFRRYDLYSGDDLIEARRGDIRFSRSDINLSIEHVSEDEDGNTTTSYERVFGGSVLRFEQDETYPERLMVVSVGFPHIREGSGLGKLLWRSEDRKVETEMYEFNRSFDSYCGDQVAARMILTPQMIEGISHFGKLIKYPLAIVFQGQYIYLFLSTPGVDSFEVCLAGNKSAKQQHEMVANQVNFIAAVIDNMYFKNRASAATAAEEPSEIMSGIERHEAFQQEIPLGFGELKDGQQGYSNTQGIPQNFNDSQAQMGNKAFGKAQKHSNSFVRFVRKYPRSVLFFVFLATCLYALFAAPYGMAIVFQDSDYVPVFPYMLVGGVFMAAFTFIGGKRGHKSLTGWAAVIIMLLIHLIVLAGSF